MFIDIKFNNDAEYFVYKAISASQIKAYDKSPYAFFKQSPFNPDIQPEEDKTALVFGGLVHCLLLEPQEAQNRYVIADFGVSRTNVKYKKLKEMNPGKIIISQAEWEHAKKMLDCLREHKLVNQIITGANAEMPIVWLQDEHNIECKAKIDAIKRTVNGLVVIDYKTSSDIASLIKHPEKLQYPLQAVHYCEAVREKYGEYPVEFVFVIQSNIQGEEDVIAVCNIDPDSFDYAQNLWYKHLYNISCKIKLYQENPDKHIFEAFPGRVFMQYPSYYINKD